MENKKKPAIRFKGFCDDWEQRKLGEINVERNEKGRITLKYCRFQYIMEFQMEN